MLCCAWSLSHVRLCNPMGYIARQAPLSMESLQARTLEWVVMPSSRGSSQPRDRTQVSHIAGGFFTICATREGSYYMCVCAHVCVCVCVCAGMCVYKSPEDTVVSSEFICNSSVKEFICSMGDLQETQVQSLGHKDPLE